MAARFLLYWQLLPSARHRPCTYRVRTRYDTSHNRPLKFCCVFESVLFWMCELSGIWNISVDSVNI